MYPKRHTLCWLEENKNKLRKYLLCLHCWTKYKHKVPLGTNQSAYQMLPPVRNLFALTFLIASLFTCLLCYRVIFVNVTESLPLQVAVKAYEKQRFLFPIASWSR